MTVKTGTSVFPYCVSEYSTCSDRLPKATRETMLSRSSSRSWSVTTFLLASGSCRSNWPNRNGLPLSALMIMGFHLPSITSAVALTGQSRSFICALPVTKLCVLDGSAPHASNNREQLFSAAEPQASQVPTGHNRYVNNKSCRRNLHEVHFSDSDHPPVSSTPGDSR
jgi:hypothetical protein